MCLFCKFAVIFVREKMIFHYFQKLQVQRSDFGHILFWTCSYFGNTYICINHIKHLWRYKIRSSLFFSNFSQFYDLRNSLFLNFVFRKSSRLLNGLVYKISWCNWDVIYTFCLIYIYLIFYTEVGFQIWLKLIMSLICIKLLRSKSPKDVAKCW